MSSPFLTPLSSFLSFQPFFLYSHTLYLFSISHMKCVIAFFLSSLPPSSLLPPPSSLSLDGIPLHSFCEDMFNQSRPCTCVCYNLSLCALTFIVPIAYIFAPCRKMRMRMTKKKMRTGLLCWSVSRKSQRLASELLFVRVVRFRIAYINVSEG